MFGLKCFIQFCFYLFLEKFYTWKKHFNRILLLEFFIIATSNSSFFNLNIPVFYLCLCLFKP